MSTQFALVSNATGFVQTFVGPDIPEHWTPPEGYSLVSADQLPEGWQREPAAPAGPLRFDNWLEFVRHCRAKAPGVYERVVATSLQSPAIFIWLSEAMGQGEMFMDHPQTIAGFAALVQAQIITQAERDAIFTP
jgi:hypothetical protein